MLGGKIGGDFGRSPLTFYPVGKPFVKASLKGLAVSAVGREESRLEGWFPC